MSRLRGRFSSPVGELFRRFSSSLAVDLEMAEEDIAGSIAHARMLGGTGVLPADEAEQLIAGLEAVAVELREGTFRPADELEDIHMAVEARLTELLGDLGGKLHTARSRNDQVATDVRLWLKRRLPALDSALVSLIAALLERAEEDGRTLMPGYTHLQRGQPIWLGHHLLAHAWPLQRDRQRLADALRRLDRCPLGACAMAGTAHPIDRRSTASELGFVGPVENAMDAVSARDHVQEVAASCAIAMTHLSRLAEELVLWSSCEVGFVRLGEGYATGSSIMPQKRNPDAAELVRGKVGGVVGDLVSLLTLTKGLPLAYNRDLQEDRAALFHAVGTTTACVAVMAGAIATLEVNRFRFDEELANDPSLATELADALAMAGVPFRQAHDVVGRLVRDLEQAGRGFSELTAEELREIHPAFPRDLGGLLDPVAAVERRRSLGGTAWVEVERQLGLLHGAIAP